MRSSVDLQRRHRSALMALDAPHFMQIFLLRSRLSASGNRVIGLTAFFCLSTGIPYLNMMPGFLWRKPMFFMGKVFVGRGGWRVCANASVSSVCESRGVFRFCVVPRVVCVVDGGSFCGACGFSPGSGWDGGCDGP